MHVLSGVDKTVLAVNAGTGEIEFGLSARYLAEALAVIDREQVELHITDRVSAVWVCGAGEPENGIGIMSMRV